MNRVPGRSYVVGGAVRDRLLGLPVSDRDHVVVGATVDEMKAAGFRPVGRDFPVFLHPETHEEYALARTERKVGGGYAGFTFHADAHVTLEEDLARRDLTVNAMAEDDVDGHLIDPFDGADDLAARVFRHVGPAFVEDPVRVLRLARFAARFADFSIAPETAALLGRMVESGEVDALVPERVWQEMSRGLAENRPSRLFDVLAACGALVRIAPLLADCWARGGVRLAEAIDGSPADVDLRLAMLLADGEADSVATACDALRVPRDARDLAVLAARHNQPLRMALAHGDSGSAAVLQVMSQADAFRRPARYRRLLDAIAGRLADAASHQTFHDAATIALDAALSVDASAIARENAYDPRRLVDALHKERLNAVTRALAAMRNGAVG